MNIDEHGEEILEALWIKTLEEKTSIGADEFRGRQTLAQLIEHGLVVSAGDGSLSLTEKGLPEARSVVRRHRLAERLLYDVLGTRDRVMHDKACKFEHLLDKGLDENICVLLGHPKVCPHNKPIPPGKCCEQASTKPHKLVSPLSELKPGQKGKVAYLYAPEAGKLQKLMAMGILPGAPVKLIQTFPSYVFQAGNSQFATDREIGDAIYVRLTEES
ncbi:MAG: metal-dependent transcriptional regulator [Dehalogenimonas sp.]|uniref:Metal-dependent transcriptional regulator n=1 Tax=Candidatus Dehalogenimonas loeffleri TaxID=3127115 RepID=A0ABZ2J8F2_9CHLR|nr:metal-dependent transcriptional regulator [Dehalogenimonas sp.]